MAFYRFTRACRQVIINYLQSRFSQHEQHWDGSEWIELPEIRIVDAAEYQIRMLPVVVTDTAIGTMRTLSFNHVIMPYKDEHGLYGPKGGTYQTYGGRGDFDITLYCAANDRELQQKLVDVTTAYLTIGRGWMWYYRFVLLGDVRILGDGVEGEVQQERVWYGNLVIPVSADWRLIVPRDEILRIDMDIDTVTPDDPFDVPDQVVQEPGLLTPMDPENARDRLAEIKAASQLSAPSRPIEDFLIDSKASADLPLRPMKSNQQPNKDDHG